MVYRADEGDTKGGAVMDNLIEAAKKMLEAADKHAIHHEHGCAYMDGPREDLRLAIKHQDDGWPKLEQPASLHDNGGATFGRGVSARLLVEAAYRNHENTNAERTKTTEQRQEDEATRRALWDMIHGATQQQAEQEVLAYRVSFDGGKSWTLYERLPEFGMESADVIPLVSSSVIG